MGGKLMMMILLVALCLLYVEMLKELWIQQGWLSLVLNWRTYLKAQVMKNG